MTYRLQVRGETVTITFKRINDSRRLPEFYSVNSRKKPNLFHIRAAMLCSVDLPLTLAPDWYKNSPCAFNPRFSGLAYCHRRDDWRSKTGRHESLRSALHYLDHDKALNGEIMAAFLAEEKRREKVKGPARTPRTAKPKPRRTERSLRAILAELRAALDRALPPTTEAGASLPALDVDDVFDSLPVFEDAKFYSPTPNGGAILPAE